MKTLQSAGQLADIGSVCIQLSFATLGVLCKRQTADVGEIQGLGSLFVDLQVVVFKVWFGTSATSIFRLWL